MRCAHRGACRAGRAAQFPEARLNGFMSWTLGIAMPWFLARLREDFRRWSTGQDRRQAMGAGELNALAQEMLKGAAGLLGSAG